MSVQAVIRTNQSRLRDSCQGPHLPGNKEKMTLTASENLSGQPRFSRSFESILNLEHVIASRQFVAVLMCREEPFSTHGSETDSDCGSSLQSTPSAKTTGETGRFVCQS